MAQLVEENLDQMAVAGEAESRYLNVQPPTIRRMSVIRTIAREGEFRKISGYESRSMKNLWAAARSNNVFVRLRVEETIESEKLFVGE